MNKLNTFHRFNSIILDYRNREHECFLWSSKDSRSEKERIIPKVKLYQMIIFSMVLNMIQSCSSPQGPEFYGRMIIKADQSIVELSKPQDSAKYRTEVLADNVEYGSVSPDGRYLLYSTDSATMLLNLMSKEQKTIIKCCITDVFWSPNSTKFCFSPFKYFKDSDPKKMESVYVYDLKDEKLRTVCYEYSKDYTSSITGYGFDTKLVGGVECGGWLNNSQFLFQRVSDYGFPAQISNSQMEKYNVIPPTTTSIAEIDSSINIADCQARRWIEGVTRDGSWILYKDVRQLKTSSKYYDPQAEKGTLRITGKFLGNDNPDSRLIEYEKYEKVGIIPRSSVIYFIPKVDFMGNQKVLLIDPESFKTTKKITIQYYDVKTTKIIMDQSEKFIAYNIGSLVMIYDIKTGGELQLPEILTDYTVNEGRFTELLAWID